MTQEQTDKFINSVVEYLKEHELTISKIVVTHHHYDHLAGVPYLLSHFPSAQVMKKVFDNKIENEVWEKCKDVVSEFEPTNLEDGDVIEVEGASLKTIFTPGHCPDHLWFLMEATEQASPVIFSGDWVLGFPSGKFEDFYEYMESLHKIKALWYD